MNRTAVCFIAALLGLSVVALANPASKVVHSQTELGLSKIMVEGVQYDKVSLPNTILTMAPGEPQLPMKLVYLIIPKDQKVEGINIVSAISEPIFGAFNIYPAQPAIPMGDPLPSFTLSKQEIYGSAEMYPGKLVEITGDGYMAGYHIVSLLVYPVQYMPSEGKLVFYNNIEFALKTAAGQDSSVSQTRRTEKAAKLYESMACKLVSNPADIGLESSGFKIEGIKKGKAGITAAPLKISSLPSEQSSPVEYVIIAPQALQSEFERLAVWKTSKGTPTVVKTVEEICQNYLGCDGAEKIRNFIKEAYAYWGTYMVLLAGDVTQVNERRCFAQALSERDTIPCDQYFSCLDRNWNYNGNSVFGEAGSEYYAPTDPDYKMVRFGDGAVGHITKGPNDVSVTTDGGENWSDLPNKPPIENSVDMDFISANTGWMAGTYGLFGGGVDGFRITHTGDGGNNWQVQLEVWDGTFDYHVYGVDIINDQVGWALGEMIRVSSKGEKLASGTGPLGISGPDGVVSWPLPGAKLWHMTDGQTWLKLDFVDFIAYGVDFIDQNTGFLVGEQGKTARTIDAGASWQTRQTAATVTLRKVTFNDAQNGWACGDNGMIVHTSDGGASWNIQSSGLTQNICDIKFTDLDHGWAVSNSCILYTTDGGNTWHQASNPGQYDLLSISAVSNNNIWISGRNGLLMHSDDGITWQIKHTGTMQFVVTGDWVDLYPDVFVGRAPVENNGEAQAWINKLMAYETAPPADYQTKMLFIGANWDAATPSGQAKDTVDVNYVQPFSQFNGNVAKLYPYDPYVLNSTEVIAALNKGYGIVNHSDHAGQYSIGAGIKTGGGNIYRTDVENLTNTAKPSVIYSLGCDAGAFDYDCIAEHFLTAPGGAVAFIGNSRYGWYYSGDPSHGPSDLYDQQFFKALLPDNIYQVGATHAVSKMALISSCYNDWGYMRWCQYGLNALGDPEMPIWTNTPKQLWVEHPGSIPIGPNTIMVMVGDNNTGEMITNALVCLQKGTEAYAMGYTDANGEIIFDYTPETTGNFNITVTSQNYRPYQGVCTVTPATGAYVCYESNQLNDAEEYSTHGNGDGIANPGESVGMYLTLKNTGTQFTPAISSVGITTTDPFISPSSFSIGFMASIPAGSSRKSLKQGVFTVLPACPDYRRVVFHVSIPATSPTWTDSFVVTIMADSLSQTGHRLIELTGDGNGVIDPGERVQISNIQVTNFGSGAADGVTAQLTTVDPYIAIETDLSAIGAIAADGIITDPNGFIFSVSPSAPTGRLYEFTLTLKDRFNRTWVQNNYELVSTAAPTGLTATPAIEGVELKWTSVTGSAGYNVYRGNVSGGPYTKINRHAVKQTGYYLDKDVVAQTQYYYVVTALDASANESNYSNEAQIYSFLSNMAGWPVTSGTRGDYNWSSAITGDIDGDGDKEVILGTNDGHIFIWHHPGAIAPNNWSKSFGTSYVSVALGDVDKCGLPEIIAGVGNAIEFKLYIYKSDGSKLSEQIVYTGSYTNTESAISLGDIDRDGILDIVLTCNASCMVYDYEFVGSIITKIWGNTTLIQTGDPRGGPTAAALGDIDNDGYSEIFVGSWSAHGVVYAWQSDGTALTGWPKELTPTGTYAVITCKPVMGDVNNDGKNEIVIEDNNTIFVLNDEATILNSWSSGDRVWGSLSLADIDRDRDLEIIAGIVTTTGLRAWHHNGVVCWSANTAEIHSSPVAADINGDGTAEVFSGSSEPRKLFGYKSNGQTLEGFPLIETDKTYSSPVIADLDDNGSAELYIDMLDGKIHAWEIPGTADPALDWPMSRHDAMNSGTFGWLNEFSGHITRNLTLSGDNFFNGDVVINPGVTVTLKPNTRMYFTNTSVKNLGTSPQNEIIIKNGGSLLAQGVVGDSVKFLSWSEAPVAGSWYGIVVESGGNIQLDYCTIENAAVGIQAFSSSLQIINSRIQGCHTGIYCNNSSAQIKSNLIVDNGPIAKSGKGLYKVSADSSASKGLDSASCIGTGIVAINSNITLDGNIIKNNYTGYYGGGNIQGTITNNTFEDNEYQGMDLYGDCFNMTITGNNYYRNAIPLNGTNGWEWAGISIGYRSISSISNVIIEGNSFNGNHAGARCTRYGSITPPAALDLIIRNNNFTASNEVGLKIASDVDPKLTTIATSNIFTGNTIYGVYVNAAGGCPLNMGDLSNASVDDDGRNRIYANGSYDLYYAVPTSIVMKAEGNFWNKKLASQVDARIYDDNENPAYGAVDFQPFYYWDWPEVDATWSGVVSIAGDIVVPENGTLKIEPGTVVRFINNFDASASGNDPTKTELVIYGQLELKGKPGEPPVIFQSDAYKPQAGDWGGITFMHPGIASKSSENNGVISRELKNCIIRHAECGLSIANDQKLEMKQCKFETNKTGASIGVPFELKTSGFTGNKLTGLIFNNEASGTLKGSNFSDNEVGIYLGGHSYAECKDDTITANGTGMICHDNSSPLVKNSILSQNKNSGVKILSSAQPNFGDDEECGHNIMIKNLPYNIYNATNNNIMAKNNYWGTMNADTVAKYIFDGNDQSILGLISYLPLWDGPKDTHHGTQLDAGIIATPMTYSLLQNSPNPMVGYTNIAFALPKPGNVGLKIYSISGQLVKTVINDYRFTGYYNIKWDGKDESGRQVSSGVYFYRICSGSFESTKKLIVLK